MTQRNRLLLLFATINLASIAQETPLWMRQPAISPDGTTIVITPNSTFAIASGKSGRL